MGFWLAKVNQLAEHQPGGTRGTSDQAAQFLTERIDMFVRLRISTRIRFHAVVNTRAAQLFNTRQIMEVMFPPACSLIASVTATHTHTPLLPPIYWQATHLHHHEDCHLSLQITQNPPAEPDIHVQADNIPFEHVIFPICLHVLPLPSGLQVTA